MRREEASTGDRHGIHTEQGASRENHTSSGRVSARYAERAGGITNDFPPAHRHVHAEDQRDHQRKARRHSRDRLNSGRRLRPDAEVLAQSSGDARSHEDEAHATCRPHARGDQGCGLSPQGQPAPPPAARILSASLRSAIGTRQDRAIRPSGTPFCSSPARVTFW